jgi:antitoxin HicB
MRRFKVLFRPEPEGGYTAIVPTLSGCISYGETLEKAKQMISDAIACYMKCIKEHGECCTDDSECVVDEIDIQDE